jgi:hypothetical protein
MDVFVERLLANGQGGVRRLIYGFVRYVGTGGDDGYCENDDCFA